jgi:hypothetical protein
VGRISALILLHIIDEDFTSQKDSGNLVNALWKIHGAQLLSELSWLIATIKQFFPMTPKRATQICQCWQAWKVFPRFEALNVAHAYPHFFRQFFLRQVPARSQ